jgi:hypothetical protein
LFFKNTTCTHNKKVRILIDDAITIRPLDTLAGNPLGFCRGNDNSGDQNDNNVSEEFHRLESFSGNKYTEDLNLLVKKSPCAGFSLFLKMLSITEI